MRYAAAGKDYFPSFGNKGRGCYPFSRLTVLHGFFQDPNFHRLLAQKALKFPDLLQCSCQLRSSNDFFYGCKGG